MAALCSRVEQQSNLIAMLKQRQTLLIFIVDHYNCLHK